MTALVAEIKAEETSAPDSETAAGYSYDSEITVSITNPDAENGVPIPGGLSWLNSARIVAEPDDDRVVLMVSIGDPRGAFAIEFRRLPDGRIVINLPNPADCLAHLPTAETGPGRLVITYDPADTSRVATFPDPDVDPEEED